MSKEGLVKELHRGARRNFKRRHNVMVGIDDTFQADLIEMIPWAAQNKGFKYILVVIDTFSKFAWVLPLKNKTGDEVTQSMHSIFLKNPNRIPKNLQTDNGKEFYNAKFKKLMESYHIVHYSTYTKMKASIAERFNRTFLNRMWYEFSLQGSHKWLKHLQPIVNSYNSTKHRTIKMKPIDVQKSYEDHLLNTVYKQNQIVNFTNKPKYKFGDYVRISKYKRLFEKGYTPNWTTEVFRIVKVLPTTPITYTLKDLKDKLIFGCFYEYELQKTDINKDIYLVEKIIRRRGDKILVKWLGLDETTWIKKSSLI